MKPLRDRLPRVVVDVAHDSVWTLTYEACAIITVTASFLMLGRELKPEGYGEYVGLFAILTPISAIGSACALSTLQYCFQEQRPVQPVLGTFLTIVAVAGTGATVVASIVASFILTDLTVVAIVTVAFGELVLVPSVRVIAGGIRARRGVPPAIRLELTMLLVRFTGLATLYAVGLLTVERLGVAWLVATAMVLAASLLTTLPALGIHPRPTRIEARDVRVAGALGAPMFVSDFQNNGDKVVLNGAGLQEEAGLYGAAFKIASLAQTPLKAMDVAVFHRFLESDEDRPGEHVRRSLLYSVWSLAVILPIAGLVLIMAPQIELIVGSEFGSSVEMTRWLMLWIPLRAVAQPPMNGLLGLARLGLRLVVLACSASISMAIYLVLIPDMGWEGAIIGTLVGEVALGGLGWLALWWAQRHRDAELAARVRAAEPVQAQD